MTYCPYKQKLKNSTHSINQNEVTRSAGSTFSSVIDAVEPGTRGDTLETETDVAIIEADVAVTEADIASTVGVDAVGAPAIDVEAIDAPIDAAADAPAAAIAAFFSSTRDVELLLALEPIP